MKKRQRRRHDMKRLAAAIVKFDGLTEQGDKIEGLVSGRVLEGQKGTLEKMAADLRELYFPLLVMAYDHESMRREAQGKGRPEQDYRAIAHKISEMADRLGIGGSTAQRVLDEGSAYSALEVSVDIDGVYGSIIGMMEERERLTQEVEELRVLTRLDSMPCAKLNALYASSSATPDER